MNSTSHLFEIVAHRGVPEGVPENTMPSFERAIDLGADAVEFDVRLTADKVPVVFHYFYLQEITSLNGPIFECTYERIKTARFTGKSNLNIGHITIPTLDDVLELIGGRIGMEIEIKGPELEAAQIVGEVLGSYRSLWEIIEVTSYEPALLLEIRKRCPDLSTDLLVPRSEDWMGLDVVAYSDLQRARLAGARAVHLHPTQLSPGVVSTIREHGIQVHAWDVNDNRSLEAVESLKIPKFSTDRLQQALHFRDVMA